MYDPTTTASNIFSFGTWVRVTNPANGRSVVVQVRDRGAFRYALDLSYAAFKLIANPALMGIPVTYQVVSGPNSAPAPARAAPSSRGGRPAPPTQYVVQPNDTLSSISVQVGVDTATLTMWNGIGDADLLQVGQTLRLTPPPATPAPSAAPSDGRSYVVQPGDTLSGIAAQYGLSADQLAVANEISDPTSLQIGVSLRIPKPSPANVGSRYVVQPGDNLSTIAATLGVSVDSILAVNQIDDPDHIPEGLTLNVPSS
jgi:LysM repeat protein